MRFAILLLTAVLVGARVRFDGYHSISINHVTSDEASLINSIVDTDERLNQIVLMNDYLSAGMEAYLLVAPQHLHYVESILQQFNVPYTITDTDYQKLVEERSGCTENPSLDKAPNCYMTLDQIDSWTEALAENYEFVTRQNIGTSVEGRSIYQLNIDGTTNDTAKHVYLNGGIHAREWISPSTMAYIAYEIITAEDGDAKRMRDSYIWNIVITMNPDGYVYTHTDNRNWRKNRRINNGSVCTGVDMNRNWDSFWGGSGSSDSPCSINYRGPNEDSEPEVQAVQSQLKSIGGENIILYMDVHSYSQLWLVPYGGNTTKPADYADLKEAGDAAAEAIYGVHNKNYTVGTPIDVLVMASGIAADWAHEKAGVKYSYSPELRPQTSGEGGFVLPETEILPSGEEILAGTIANIDVAEEIEAR